MLRYAKIDFEYRAINDNATWSFLLMLLSFIMYYGLYRKLRCLKFAMITTNANS
jgi:hypothetical protein